MNLFTPKISWAITTSDGRDGLVNVNAIVVRGIFTSSVTRLKNLLTVLTPWSANKLSRSSSELGRGTLKMAPLDSSSDLDTDALICNSFTRSKCSSCSFCFFDDGKMISSSSLDHLMVFVTGPMIAHSSLVKCCFSDRLKRLNALGWMML